MSYAQTNIQLYGQLFQADWTVADLRRVQAAYELAMRLFAGHFRPNQKPFLAHLVGVASILAAHGGDSTIVAAGLLHSAHSHGEFGDGSRGISDSKRRTIRHAVGDACESLIARYSAHQWKLPEIAALTASAGALSAMDRNAAFVKLADVLEDHLDRGMQYSPNKQMPGGSDAEGACRDALVRLASALGCDRLATELQAALAATHERPVPDFLLGHKPASFVIAPISHRMKATVRFLRFLRRWRGKLIGHSPQHIKRFWTVFSRNGNKVDRLPEKLRDRFA